MFIQHLLITILLTCCSFVIDNVNVGYFHNVFRFVFVCNVFWVEFQCYGCCSGVNVHGCCCSGVNMYGCCCCGIYPSVSGGGGYMLFSSVFSISFHYSTYFSSIISLSFHYSTWVSSIFFISFHYSILSISYYYSTCLSSILFHISTYFSSIFSISFHSFLPYFPNLFTIQLTFLP